MFESNKNIDIQDQHDGLSIKIKNKTPFFHIIFLSIWLIGWAIAEYAILFPMLNDLEEAGSGFKIIWIIAWTFGGLSAIYSLIKALFGAEVLFINLENISIRHQILRLGRTKHHAIQDIKNVELNAFFGNDNNEHGLILFEKIDEHFSFGRQLDSIYGTKILTIIKNKLPRIRPSAPHRSPELQ